MHTALKQIRLDAAPEGDLRCHCGKLLARVLHTVLELKCPRCKRVVLVSGGQRFEPVGTAACACAEPFSSRPSFDDRDP
jgi:hypothetical protein